MQSRCTVGGAKKNPFLAIFCSLACARSLVHVSCPLNSSLILRLFTFVFVGVCLSLSAFVCILGSRHREPASVYPAARLSGFAKSLSLLHPYYPGGHLKKCRSPSHEKCRKSVSESAGPKRGAEQSAEKSAPGPARLFLYYPYTGEPGPIQPMLHHRRNWTGMEFNKVDIDHTL